jgi:hypothetical protein
MAGKRAVCPNCKSVIEIPEKYVPALVVPDPREASAHEPMTDAKVPPALDITKPAEQVSPAEEERAALRLVRFGYIFLRDDWRRLPTCSHLWFVFFLFFLPWINLSCNSRIIATQTGLQTCLGSATVNPKVEKLARNVRNLPEGNQLRPMLEEMPPWSLLSVVYVLFVFLGGLVGFACMGCIVFRLKMAAAGAHLASLGLGGTACLALSAQMLIGFPIDKHARLQLDKAIAEQERRNAAGFRNEGVETLLDVEVNYTFWLWLSWLMTLVSAPVFVVEFGVLVVDAMRKYRQQSEESG